MTIITTLLSSGVIIKLIERGNIKHSNKLKEELQKIDSRIDGIERNQIDQTKTVKKSLLRQLLIEYDQASKESKPWIEEKIIYEYEHYKKAPINGNSWMENELKKRNII